MGGCLSTFDWPCIKETMQNLKTISMRDIVQSEREKACSVYVAFAWHG